MATLSSGTHPLRRGLGPVLKNHGPNIAAPAIVTPPAAKLFDYSAKLDWPMTNNQFDNLGLSRDWYWTLNGTQHRYGGVRYQPTWQFKGRGAFPGWQPAIDRVDRVYRKGASGAALRTLVFEREHNTNQIRAGDTCWLYLVGDFEGSANPATSVDVGGFSLPLKKKLTVAACTPSPDNPADSKSYVEVTFTQDLPAVNYTPPALGTNDPKLLFVHHSFYADATTRRLRYPLSWHLDILKNDVLGNGGHVVVGGLQRIPTWACWTTWANYIGDYGLVFEQYRMEQEGLAYHFAGSDPTRLVNELENEAVLTWTPTTDQPLGLRQSLIDYMMPIARTAWGPDYTLIAKAGGFGGLNDIWAWDIDVAATFGDSNVLLGNHNYASNYAPRRRGGNQLWYDDTSDCNYHMDSLKSIASTYKFKGAIITEYSAPNTDPVDLRGRFLGKFHSAATRAGIPLCYWDLVGDLFGCSWLGTNVPGAPATANVQRIEPELWPYCGKAGISV